MRHRANANAFKPYAPLGVPKPFAEGLWIVDGPEITMSLAGIRLPFPTRMTVARLPDGTLWIHSPISASEDLLAEIDALGPVAHIVAPNSLHYWYMPAWQGRYPQARSYGPPGIARRAKRLIAIDETITDVPPESWQSQFEMAWFPGRIMSEVAFLHRPSRTLILTDLIENFELSRVNRPWLRWLLRIGGPVHPNGTAPFDMRFNFRKDRKAVRDATRKLLQWVPERIILAHGRCYTRNGQSELMRAFAWAL